jgi:hypothetical protein
MPATSPVPSLASRELLLAMRYPRLPRGDVRFAPRAKYMENRGYFVWRRARIIVHVGGPAPM